MTVHVAIGTDTPHTHPQPMARPSGRRRIAISACCARWCAGLTMAAFILNLGSAVVLPEVFLKAVSVVRNLGHPLAEFHHREFRFSAALPAKVERGRAAACEIGRTWVRDYRPP